MKALLVFVLIMGISCPLCSQDISENGDLELSSGFSMLLYQSVYSYQLNSAIEMGLRGDLIEGWDWQVGTHFGINPMLPDLYVRLLAAPEVRAWQPSVGFEFGFTNRAHFEAGDKLLRETRVAMEGDISHFYIAGHSAPLSFKISNNWRVSVLELHIGTHVGHLGRTARVQIGVISLGKKF